MTALFFLLLRLGGLANISLFCIVERIIVNFFCLSKFWGRNYSQVDAKHIHTREVPYIHHSHKYT